MKFLKKFNEAFEDGEADIQDPLQFERGLPDKSDTQIKEDIEDTFLELTDSKWKLFTHQSSNSWLKLKKINAIELLNSVYTKAYKFFNYDSKMIFTLTSPICSFNEIDSKINRVLSMSKRTHKYADTMLVRIKKVDKMIMNIMGDKGIEDTNVSIRGVPDEIVIYHYDESKKSFEEVVKKSKWSKFFKSRYSYKISIIGFKK
jgi:hypothetical protein